MERLTSRNEDCVSVNGHGLYHLTMTEVVQMADRLAAYEDTGREPEEVTALGKLFDYALKESKTLTEQLTLLKHIRELAEADKDGRCVVRPCKVGDKLYRVFAGEIFEHKVRNMRYLAIQGRWDIDTTPFCSYVESSIGKTIFLTHEQAEKALEEMKDVCP